MPISLELTPMMMREIIHDHYASPRNKSNPEGEGYLSLHSHSENCIDDIDVFLHFKEDGTIDDAKWNGTACAISTASTDILCSLLVGHSKDEALRIIEEYHHMIHEEPYDASVLEEALAFMNTSKQAARIHCATIGWDAAKAIIEEDK